MTSFNGFSDVQIQRLALAGAAISSFFCAAKNCTKTFIGSDSSLARLKNWDSAKNQSGYWAAMSKRIQYFVGSDSLSARFTNLFKSTLLAAGSIILANLLQNAGKNDVELNQLKTQLTQYDAASHEAKEIASQYIEACWQTSVNTGYRELVRCIIQAVPGIFSNLTAITDQLNLCNNSFTSCINNSLSLASEKAIQEGQLLNLNQTYTQYQQQCEQKKGAFEAQIQNSAETLNQAQLDHTNSETFLNQQLSDLNAQLQKNAEQLSASEQLANDRLIALETNKKEMQKLLDEVQKAKMELNKMRESAQTLAKKEVPKA